MTPNWKAEPEETSSSSDASPAQQDVPSSPDTASHGSLLNGVPRTAYLWLIILILSYILPFVAEGGLRQVRQKAQIGAGDTTPLNEANFSKYLQAESQSRVAFAASAASRAAKANLSGVDAKQRAEAIKLYKELAVGTNSPNMARKVLILQNLQGKPFDELYLTGTLQRLLQKTKRTPAQIQAEVDLWRKLYKTKRFDGGTSMAVDQIKAMRLRFMESQALSDLHAAAGQKNEAARYLARMDEKALQSSGRLLALNGSILVALLIGVVFFIIYCVAAGTKKWHLVHRVATQPQIAGWVEMLDAFLFYLAFFRGGGFLFGLALANVLKQPSLSAEIGIEFAFYVGSGIVALLYLNHSLRRRGATLADVGFRSVSPKGVWAEIGYGIAGYCAVLPLSIGLKLLGERIFGENPDSIPNPVFPLITSAADDPVLRTLLYMLVALGAPLFEEIFFRGALFSGLRTRSAWWVAAIISAMLFAVVHPMQDWIAIFGLGLGFATMREMRQSLYPGMTAHLLQNSFAFFATSTIFSS